MKMDVVAGSGNDEFYTPEYAVRPILKYVDPKWTIWCPFDTEQSHFVRLLKQNGNMVLSTHLSSGQDFFTYEPDVQYDAIISNPPYSLKNEVFERLFSLSTKFAMLVGVVGLFESQKRFDLFNSHDFEILYLNRRVAYFKSYEEQQPSLNPPFSSVYVTRGILPERIVFEEIQKTRLAA